ncbi:MAG TPA: hypothetical protein VFZ08_14985 [Terriglobia bacterium]|nr:hypothetical protein [Terriglobia bacterium]
MAEGSSTVKWFVLAAVALAVATAVYVSLQRRQSQSAAEARVMSPAEKGYLQEIEITGAKMSAASNFLGSSLYYLDGQIVNHGPKDVRQLDLSLTFMDPFGQVVLRRTEHPITLKTAPLKAGQTQRLHIVFEHLPEEWNQGPPVIAPSYVKF